jgi:hypothetical protein
MVQQITPYIQTIIIALVGALVTIACIVIKRGEALAVSYVESKIGGNQLASLKGYAQTVVRSLEQSPIYTNFDGSKKKELAILDVTQYCKNHNLPFGYTAVDKVIEEAVQIMNVELGKPLSDWINSDEPASTTMITSTDRYSAGPVA